MPIISERTPKAGRLVCVDVWIYPGVVIHLRVELKTLVPLGWEYKVWALSVYKRAQALSSSQPVGKGARNQGPRQVSTRIHLPTLDDWAGGRLASEPAGASRCVLVDHE
jgi:hypothetical protein